MRLDRVKEVYLEGRPSGQVVRSAVSNDMRAPYGAKWGCGQGQLDFEIRNLESTIILVVQEAKVMQNSVLK